MTSRIAVAPLLAAFALLSPARSLATRTVYHVDAAGSRVVITVGKAGAFSFVAGHTHQVSGPIESGTIDVNLDDLPRSHVAIVIPTATLKVSGADEPPDDRPKVQQAMEGERVLNVARYPRMTFDSTAVTMKRREGETVDAVVSGRLTIRDVTRPVTAPVHLAIADHSLRADGRFSIKQTAFGITPISVGGIVAVKDALDISFSIVAR